MAEELLVYTHKRSARLMYVLDFVFHRILGYKLKVLTQWDAFEAEETILKINYSSKESAEVYTVYPLDLLFETDLFEQPIHLLEWESIPIIYGHNYKSQIPFDLFAASFYCISRYEEYLPFLPDAHNRFAHTQSWATKLDLLKRPLVNEWIRAFHKSFRAFYQLEEAPKAEASLLISIDVDNSYAFRGKGPIRSLTGWMKDLYELKMDYVKGRWDTLVRGNIDPFDNYDFQIDCANRGGVPLIYFVLYSELSNHDRNISRFSLLLKKSVRHLSDFALLGIHPSYRSNEDFKILEEEFKDLEIQTRRKIRSSRQHYLMLKLPSTYRKLMRLGIQHDYSMGYSQATGWRASCCSPFLFYDLEMEEATDLVIHPFPFMDSVYFDHLKIPASEALKEIELYSNQVKELGGELVALWHNRSFSEMEAEWKGWKENYETLIEWFKK